jgi:hypothetical protein
VNLREAIGQALDVLDIPPFTANLHDFARVNSEAAHILRQAYSQPDQDDTALLRQALEALETFQKISDFTPAQGVHAITALRERLGETK